MSDIGLKFPIWANVAFLGLLYWHIFAPAALVLCGIGWFGRGLPKAARYASLGAAGLCATPFGLLLVLALEGIIDDSQRAAEFRALHRTLVTDETVGTLFVPAGAVLEYTDKTLSRFRSIELPRPVVVANILLKGMIEPLSEREWIGNLAQDQVIGDWPCRAGVLWFTSAGVATRCTLAAEYRVAGYDLPAGTNCQRIQATGGWMFQVPQDGPPLRIAALNADLPPGGTLVLTADGAPRRLYVPHEAPMVIAGVSLFDDVILNETGLTGELAEPRLVAGVVLPAEAVVGVDLTTGHVETTNRSKFIDP